MFGTPPEPVPLRPSPTFDGLLSADRPTNAVGSGAGWCGWRSRRVSVSCRRTIAGLECAGSSPGEREMDGVNAWSCNLVLPTASGLSVCPGFRSAIEQRVDSPAAPRNRSALRKPDRYTQMCFNGTTSGFPVGSQRGWIEVELQVAYGLALTGGPMLGKVFPKSHSPLQKMSITDLVPLLQRVCRMSFITRSEKSSSYDFDRSLPLLTEIGLEEHVSFVSHPSKTLPLNSERHLYQLGNIIIRNLHIELSERSAWAAHDDWEPLSAAKWHFANCHFYASGSNMYTLHFPWSGSFRFYKNAFDFRPGRGGGYWLFVFQAGSRILFQANDFRNHSVQTRCVPRTLVFV